MKSMEIITNMLIEAKDYKSMEMIYNLYALVREIVAETVPPLVSEEVQKIKEKINVITLLNGRRADLDGLRDDIERLINQEIAKINK